MMIQKLRLALAAAVVCGGVALAGGVALQAQPGDPLPAVPDEVANVPAADPPDKEKASPKTRIEEADRKEIEDLRKRIDALERKLALPAPLERQKIVVTSPQIKDVAATQQYVGKVRAHHHINVRSLANGLIAEVLVKEGQAVKKGDVLFKVLPILYKAKLDAELAEVRIAQIEFDSTKKLGAGEKPVVSQQEVALAEAKLAKAQAKAKLAQADLEFTVVRAPFDGFVGRLPEQVGSAVKEGDTLTTLSDNSAVWVYFNVPEARYLEYMANRAQMKEGPPIELVLANGRKYSQTGKIGAIEGQFTNDTGTIAFRADFTNPDHLLRHGQSGTVLIREPLKRAVVIPQRATFEILDKRYVYVVGKDGVAHQREIGVQNELEGVFVINKGLDVNDRIVVDGVRQVRDGEKVEYEFRKPEEVIGDANQPAGK